MPDDKKTPKPGDPGAGNETKPEEEKEKEPTGEHETPEAETTDKQDEKTRELIRRLRAREKDAEKAEKALAALQKAEEERKQSEMTELQKTADKLAKAEKALQDERTKNMQIQAATAAGIPLELASRLVGTTVEEMQEDAKTILGLFPKAVVKKQGAGGTGNPPEGSADEETEAEKRARLLQ